MDNPFTFLYKNWIEILFFAVILLTINIVAIVYNVQLNKKLPLKTTHVYVIEKFRNLLR